MSMKKEEEVKMLQTEIAYIRKDMTDMKVEIDMLHNVVDFFMIHFGGSNA